MIVKPVRTEKIAIHSSDLLSFLDRSLPDLSDGSVLVITSKIISVCQGRVVKIGTKDKAELIHEEADRYIPPENSPHNITLTITNNLLVPTAGIDESNGDGYYILWPKDVQQNARAVRDHFAQKFGLHNFGVIVTDSRTTPMRWGVTGVALAYSGFTGLNDFIGKPDLFGRHMEVTVVNVADALAAAAVLVMGETNEQTPLAVIAEVPFVSFDAGRPTDQELATWHIPMDVDLYGPILKTAPWRKGKG